MAHNLFKKENCLHPSLNGSRWWKLCNTMDFLKYSKFKKWEVTHSSKQRPLSVYQHISYAATPSLQCLTPSFLFGFQNSTTFIFKLSHYYIFWFIYLLHHMFHKPLFSHDSWQSLICLLSISGLPEHYFDVRC